jgi:hypothetical protein
VSRLAALITLHYRPFHKALAGALVSYYTIFFVPIKHHPISIPPNDALQIGAAHAEPSLGTSNAITSASDPQMDEDPARHCHRRNYLFVFAYHHQDEHCERHYGVVRPGVYEVVEE